LVAGSDTTYWIEKVRLSKKPATSGLEGFVNDYPRAGRMSRDGEPSDRVGLFA